MNLKWALDMESDRMVNSFIKKEDFDKEFSVVRNEFEMGENSPFNVLFEHTMAAAYTAHSYGRPVIGNKSDVERVTMDKLQAFYHKYYQPDNAVLTVAGKVDEPQIVALVNEYFGKIPRPTRTLTPTYTVEPVQDGERLTVVRRVGDIQGIFIVYHTPDGGHPDHPHWTFWPASWANSRRAGCTRRWSTTRKPPRSSAMRCSKTSRASSCSPLS